jgi:YidC/Oxa1 family membrane protein insertase
MDRNTIVGFVLIGLILIGYSYYNFEQAKKHQKNKPKNKKENVVSESAANGKSDSITITPIDSLNDNEAASAIDDSTKQAQLNTNYGAFAGSLEGEEKSVSVENNNLKITFTNKGGNIKSLLLKDYKTYDKDSLILFDGDEFQLNYSFYLENNRVLNTNELFFSNEKIISNADGSKTISFKLNAGEGKYFEQSYTIPSSGFDVSYKVILNGLNDVIKNNSRQISFNWLRTIRKVEQGKDFENRYTQLHYSYTNEEDEQLSETENEEKILATDVRWIAAKQQFFNTTIINKEGFESVKLKSTLSTKNNQLKNFETEAYLPYNHQNIQEYNMVWFFGPNRYQKLKKLDLGLEALIPLGTGIMSWVSVFNKWLIIPIFNFLEKFTGNYGLIILILTLIIKFILFPLTYKSYKSAALMKALKPELDALKEKYADDQQKFGTEQWKLYQQAGVNPLGGCLPMLLQMPILIAMYYFFPASIELRQESFLWAHDLSTYDSILNLPFSIPFYGDHVSLFTLLMTVTSILYAVTNNQMMGNTTQPGMEMMKYMPYIFPILLMGMFNSFPAALTYYYFLQNLISYGQQWSIKKWFIDEDALHKQIQINKKKPVKKSMFQTRLEEMAKQQQQKGKGKNR